MSKELNTIAPKKWTGDYSGSAPTLDITDGVRVGDIAVETGATDTDQIWRCLDNTDTAPVWTREHAGVENTITLGPANADYTDFNDAMAAVTALSPSVSKPVSLLVYAGIYTIDPTVVPSYVSIVGLGGTGLVIFEPSDANDVQLTMGTSTNLTNIGITNASGANGVGVKIEAGASRTYVLNCLITGNTKGIWVDGSGSAASVYDTTIVHSGSNTVGVYATDSAQIDTFNTTIRGLHAGALLQDGYYADGGIILVNNILTTLCTDGVHVDDGGSIFVTSGLIGSCTNAIHLGSTGTTSSADFTAVNVQGNTTYDLILDGATNNLFFSGVFDISKTSIADGATAALNAYSEFSGDEGTVIWGQQEIGRVGAGNELAVGEGDSTVVGMSVQTNTNGEAGSWVDETSAAISSSGSTVTMFPGVSAENCLYIGGDFEFVGFKMSDISTAITLGSGALIMEYWNGASWLSFNYMETKADAPYTHRANNIFENTDDIQIRFGEITSWATKSLNTVTKYWIRIRVATAITTSPVFQQIKLSTNRNELNADGFRETFGAAEQVKIIPVDYTLRDVVGFGSGNVDLNFGTNTGISAGNNNRASTAKDGSGGVFLIPRGLDTSLPIIMHIQWYVAGTGTGDVEIEGALANFTTGDILDGTLPEISDADIKTISVASDGIVQETELSFDVPDALEGDSIAFSCWRDATAGNTDDTLGEATPMVAITLSGTYWR